MRLIPEFGPTEMIEAVEACVDIGVAKIAGLLGDQSIEQLRGQIRFGGEVVAADDIIDHIPELHIVKSLLFSEENVLRGMRLYMSGYTIDAIDKSMGISSHTDSYPSSQGLSLLLPVDGNVAIFAAGNDKFDLSIDTFEDEMTTSLPEMVAEYGVGDGMLVRQQITRLNCLAVDLAGIYHCGAADTVRYIAALDIVTDNLVLS